MRHSLLTSCPGCGQLNEFHDGPTKDTVPEATDISICWRCKHVGVYEDGPFGLYTRSATEEELAEIKRLLEYKQMMGLAMEVDTPVELSTIRWMGQ